MTFASVTCVQATSGGVAVLNSTSNGSIAHAGQIGLGVNGPAGTHTAAQAGNLTVNFVLLGDYQNEPTWAGGSIAVSNDFKTITMSNAMFNSSVGQVTLNGTYACS